MAMTKKSPKTLKAVEDKLRAEREELLVQIADLEKRAAGEDAGTRVYDDVHGEPETATYERERVLSLLDNSRDLLEQVNVALERIDAGTYGICASCGKPIEAARVKALPHASLCIACKRREERR
jgi:DnaK suppressor protein